MLEFRNGALHAESVPLQAIAREHGTPCHVFSRAELRSALTWFQACHDSAVVRNSGGSSVVYDVAGPVCESADFRGKERERPEAHFALEHHLR